MVGQVQGRVETRASRGCAAVRYHVVVLPRAKRDAHEIDDYLSGHNPAAADRFFENLQATLDLQAAIATPGSPWITRNPALGDLRWTRVKGADVQRVARTDPADEQAPHVGDGGQGNRHGAEDCCQQAKRIARSARHGFHSGSALGA